MLKKEKAKKKTHQKKSREAESRPMMQVGRFANRWGRDLVVGPIHPVDPSWQGDMQPDCQGGRIS